MKPVNMIDKKNVFRKIFQLHDNNLFNRTSSAFFVNNPGS